MQIVCISLKMGLEQIILWHLLAVWFKSGECAALTGQPDKGKVVPVLN
jgi:hypothetical protein